MIFTSILWLFADTILISIPEVLFIVLFTLSHMGRHDDFLKLDLKKIMRLAFAVVIPALLSNLIRYSSGYTISFMPAIGIALITLMISLSYHLKTAKEVLSSILFVILASTIIMILELVYMRFLTSVSSISVDAFSKPGISNFLIVIPERVAEALIILGLISMRSKLKVNGLQMILKKSLNLIVAIIALTMNFAITYFFSIVIIQSKVLLGLDAIHQLLILTVVILFPVLNICILIVSMYYLSSRKQYESRFVQEEALALKLNINSLYLNGKHEDILVEVDKFYTFLGEKEKYM